MLHDRHTEVRRVGMAPARGGGMAHLDEELLMRAAWLLLPSLSLSASLAAGCLRSTEFHCTTSEQCAPNGTCEAVGYCGFPDSECGQRFGSSAGQYAGQCVDSGPMGADSGVDAPPTDAPPSANCPATYAAVTNGTPGHVYRRIQTATIWATQLQACASDAPTKSYLAVPNDLAELGAIATLAAAGTFWVGIDDRVTEGTYIQAPGGPAPVPAVGDRPARQRGRWPGQDCVRRRPRRSATRTVRATEAIASPSASASSNRYSNAANVSVTCRVASAPLLAKAGAAGPRATSLKPPSRSFT